MSLQPQAIGEIPEETRRVAERAFPKGNVYMRMRDELGTIYRDEQFTELYPRRGQPGYAPWRMALVMVMQFAENLSDRQAAEAVRGRIDWKYALGLELDDAGFDYSVLSEFRQRLLVGGAEQQLLETMLAVFQERGWLKAGQRQRTDATHILANVRTLNRLELVGESLRQALEVVAEVAPYWLKAQVTTEWFELYSQPFHNTRLPDNEEERQLLAETIGRHGQHLLQQIYAASAPQDLASLSAVDILRRVWITQYYQEEGEVYWRTSENVPPAEKRIVSPFDVEARYSTKRNTTAWTGYKAHLTETCEPDRPHLITHVVTTPATDHDVTVVETIHTDLERRDLLPSQHLLDRSYVSGEGLVASQQREIDMVGPVRGDPSWQARAGQGYALADFHLDWETQTATCPQGNTSRRWRTKQGSNNKPKLEARFAKADCLACPARSLCTTGATHPRSISFLPRPEYEALQAARQRQETGAFKRTYQQRAGIEGTIAQAVTTLGMRRSRYRGLAKTHVQHVLTATAMNLMRVMTWLTPKPPPIRPPSRFAALAA